MNLVEYVRHHTIKGACLCGECVDAPEHPEEHQPPGKTSDVQFFEVALINNPDKDKLMELIKEHRGEFCNVDLFDGKEHSFIEIGGWIGDQGNALALMGMGELLEIWSLFTPNKLMPTMSEKIKMMAAGAGYVTIQYLNKSKKE